MSKKPDEKNSMERNGAERAVLPKEAHGRIGQQLRRIYGDMLAEPLPDKFSQLLDELSKSERKNDSK